MRATHGNVLLGFLELFSVNYAPVVKVFDGVARNVKFGESALTYAKMTFPIFNKNSCVDYVLT
jgi:hypothetical protein